MVLPTIATSIIVHSMLDHDYISQENDEYVRGETTKMSTADHENTRWHENSVRTIEAVPAAVALKCETKIGGLVT